MCDKRGFPSKREAQEALNWIKKNRGRKGMKSHKEKRTYYCEDCNTWHLTKKRGGYA